MDASARTGGERTTVVLGVSLALVVLGALVWTLVTQRTRALDAPQLFAEWFEARELPMNFGPVEAQTLPRGDRVLRLERSDIESEDPLATPPEKPAEPGPGGPPQFDWSKVRLGAAKTRPREVLIVELPIDYAASDLDALFKGGQELGGDWKSIPAQGGKRVMERGRLRWAAFEPSYVIEREFENGGTFRDVLRVNLSRRGSPRILIARWNRGFPASKERVEELLAALTPRE